MTFPSLISSLLLYSFLSSTVNLASFDDLELSNPNIIQKEEVLIYTKNTCDISFPISNNIIFNTTVISININCYQGYVPATVLITFTNMQITNNKVSGTLNEIERPYLRKKFEYQLLCLNWEFTITYADLSTRTGIYEHDILKNKYTFFEQSILERGNQKMKYLRIQMYKLIGSPHTIKRIFAYTHSTKLENKLSRNIKRMISLKNSESDIRNSISMEVNIAINAFIKRKYLKNTIPTLNMLPEYLCDFKEYILLLKNLESVKYAHTMLEDYLRSLFLVVLNHCKKVSHSKKITQKDIKTIADLLIHIQLDKNVKNEAIMEVIGLLDIYNFFEKKTKSQYKKFFIMPVFVKKTGKLE